MGTDSDDVKDENAIKTIAANCPGIAVRSLLRSNEPHFKPEKIRELAGTSPEYQRHVMQRAKAGDQRPLKKIASSLFVYETVKFGEVTSRLHRAVGMVRREVDHLTRAIEKENLPDQLADRLLTLDLVAEQADRLRDLLTEVETVEGPDGKKSESRRPDKELTDKLHAAGGLGLIAKNVHNVAVLQSAHRPTPKQKELALRLTTEAFRLAVAARDATRRAFGRADDACRVRPGKTPTRRVIIHDKIDGDAVVAAWFVERFLFEGKPSEVLFVHPKRELGAYRVGDRLVDIGYTHDPKNLFFDHKPPACSDKGDSCSSRQVWDHLTKLGHRVQHLKPLVNVVFAGDSTIERPWFKHEFAESQQKGFHKALKDAKTTHSTAAAVYRVMRQWLNRHDKKTATRKD